MAAKFNLIAEKCLATIHFHLPVTALEALCRGNHKEGAPRGRGDVDASW